MNLLLFLLFYSCVTDALLELEQAEVLYVCLGRSLNVKCSTSADLLQWNVTTSDRRMWTRELSKIGVATRANPIQISSLSTLNVTRTLNDSLTLPLISMLKTDNVAIDINRTQIICQARSSDRGVTDQILANSSVQIIVQVGNNNTNITPNIEVHEHFGMENVTIDLIWTHRNGVSYSVNIESVAITYPRGNGARLVASYNTKYNVSVIAILCGNNRTTFTLLNYVTCRQPEPDSSIVISYNHPAIEGTVATVSCCNGLILAGPSSTTCTENGQWEPDLKEANCKVDCRTPPVNGNVSLNYTSTLQESLLTFQCKDGLFPDRVFTSRCYRNGTWIPNPSNHLCATSSAVTCSDPSPPPDGYLEPYTSTSEGAMINIVHVCQDGLKLVEENVCSPGGQWVLVNGSTCTDFDSTVNSLAIISGSLGSLLAVALLVCGILIVVIIIGRKRDSSSGQRHGERQFFEDHYIKGKSEESKHQNPEYEEVMTSGNEVDCDDPEDLEMMKNVAYGPLHLK